MSWVILLFAGVFEIVWALALKESNGFRRLWPSVITLSAMAVSVALLAWALKQLPLGTAYAVWTGIGAVGTVLCGIWLYHDSAAWPRLVCIGMIVFGIIGLKMLPESV